MNTLKKIRANQKGFTLVELIVVVAILGVLAAVAVPNYMNYLYKTRVSTDVDAARAVINAARTMYMTSGTVPTLDAVLADTDLGNTKPAVGGSWSTVLTNLAYDPTADEFSIKVNMPASGGKNGKYTVGSVSGRTGTVVAGTVYEHSDLPQPVKSGTSSNTNGGNTNGGNTNGEGGSGS